jgi:hypothetical protein
MLRCESSVLFGAMGLINTLCVVHQRMMPFLAATGVAFLRDGEISGAVTGGKATRTQFCLFHHLSSIVRIQCNKLWASGSGMITIP